MQELQGNLIGLLQGDVRVALGQGGEGLAVAQGVEQFGAKRVDQVDVHGEGSRGLKKKARPNSVRGGPKGVR
ncbi:hypothetical protein D3C72_2463620 [compost metagenome]